MRSPENHDQFGPLSRQQFAVGVGVGRATAARVDMRGDQAAQGRAVAARLRNLTGGAGTLKVAPDFRAELRRIAVVGQPRQRGGTLGRARKFLVNLAHPVGVPWRVEKVAPIQRLDQIQQRLGRQQVRRSAS